MGETQSLPNPPATTTSMPDPASKSNPQLALYKKSRRSLPPRIEEAFASIAVWKIGGDKGSNKNCNSTYEEGFHTVD